MRQFIPIALSLTLLCFTSIGTLSSQDTEVRQLSSFDGISVSASIDARLVKGSKNEIEITVKGVDLDKVSSEIKNGVLEVGMKRNNKKWSWSNNSDVDVTITYTDYPTYIGVSSSADIISRDIIKTDRLELKASSSGDLILEIEVEELKASVSSSADIKISGSANEASVSASSSGGFMGKELKVNDANITASSSGDVAVRVSGTIAAHASSSGDIVYYGNPKSKDVSKSSGGSVKQKS